MTRLGWLLLLIWGISRPSLFGQSRVNLQPRELSQIGVPASIQWRAVALAPPGTNKAIKDGARAAAGALLLGATTKTTVLSLRCAATTLPLSAAVCEVLVLGSAGLDVAEALQFLRIANDPPDSDFTVISSPASFVVSIPNRSDLPKKLIDTINAYFENQSLSIGFARAHLTSIERAQGAALAGNGYWESRQLEAAAVYAGELSALLERDISLRSDVLTALHQAGVGGWSVSASDIGFLQTVVETVGLPPRLVELLNRLDLQEGSIESFKDYVLGIDVSQFSNSAFPEDIIQSATLNAVRSLALAMSDYSKSVLTQVDIEINPRTLPPARSDKPANAAGMLPVVILDGPTFDVGSIETASLSFGLTGNEPSLASCAPIQPQSSANHHGSLLCLFNVGETALQSGNRVAILKGATRNGARFFGVNSVRSVP